MYKFKNGKLYKDGEAVFGVGVSYYPSFHPRKAPVENEEERMGEMVKDIRLMKDAGFNIFRTAAIGELSKKDGKISAEVGFIENMLDEAEKNDLAAMVRLHGYVTNLSNNKDIYMYDQDNVPAENKLWNNFIVCCLQHGGIVKDVKDITGYLTEIFSKHSNFVSAQIYNEPHYPFIGIYDYHPLAIEAYNKWLEKNGLKEQNEHVEPPRRRPYYDEDAEAWINWRKFARSELSEFLNSLADIAVKTNPGIAACTCCSAGELSSFNAETGDSFFDMAKGMDFLGITTYVLPYGEDFYTAALKLCLAENAAFICGKTAWIIEYDAATDISVGHFYKESYLAACSGHKGIIYYQWRGDYISKNSDVPEGNKYGLINYDGTKTKNYDEKLKMIELLNKMSPYIVNADKIRQGAVILYSEHAYLYADACENEMKTLEAKWGEYIDSFAEGVFTIYRDIKKRGIEPTIVNSKDFEGYIDKCKALYISEYRYMSKEDKRLIELAEKRGIPVYALVTADRATNAVCGYAKISGGAVMMKNGFYTMGETLEETGIKPVITVYNEEIQTQIIEGRGYVLASLVNISLLKETVKNVKIHIEKKPKKVELIDTDKTLQVDAKSDIVLDEVKHGAFLLLEY